MPHNTRFTSHCSADLAVLLVFAGGLAFLALQDSKKEARREASLREMMDAAEMLRAQGLEDEAAALDSEVAAQRKPKKPKAPKKRSMAGDPFDDAENNRFARRQGRTAKRKRKRKRA